MDILLPHNLSQKQRDVEQVLIRNFILQFNNIRKEYSNVDRDFADSYVIDNVSALIESYSFVSLKYF